MSEDGSMLGNDENIFATEVSSDEGVGGRMDFFGRQCKMIEMGSTRLDKLAPGIMHFSKYDSNIFRSFEEKCK